MTDGLWETHKQQLRELEKQGDYHGLSNLLRDIARDLYWDGRNFMFVARKAMRVMLVDYYRNSCVSRVSVMTRAHGSCEACKDLEGKVFTIKEALREMPLPVGACHRRLSGINQKEGFCECTYVPYLEEGRGAD